MNCTIIKDYKSIKTQLGNGIQCDCKINDIEKLVQEDYINLLKSKIGFSCADDIAINCTYCSTCNEDITNCNRIEITSSGPNNLSVSPLNPNLFKICYEDSTSSWDIEMYFNISFNNPATVLTSNIDSVKIDGTPTTLIGQDVIYYDALNMRWVLKFKPINNNIYSIYSMKVDYTISDGVSFISDAIYIDYDNSIKC